MITVKHLPLTVTKIKSKRIKKAYLDYVSYNIPSKTLPIQADVVPLGAQKPPLQPLREPGAVLHPGK